MSILLPVTKSFNVNKLPPVKSWTGVNTSVVDNSLVIGNNGNANVSLSLSGLNSSSFRLLRIVFDATLPEMSNLSNSSALEFVIKYRYLRNVEAGSDEVVSVYNYLYQSLVLTPLNCTTEGGHLVCEKIVACPELDCVSIECSIYNRTGASATIISCTLKQSYDTQPNQIAENIDWSMNFAGLDVYTDGVLVTYSGDSEPLEAQWQEVNTSDPRDFDVLVNGSLTIPIRHHNSSL